MFKPGLLQAGVPSCPSGMWSQSSVRVSGCRQAGPFPLELAQPQRGEDEI